MIVGKRLHIRIAEVRIYVYVYINAVADISEYSLFWSEFKFEKFSKKISDYKLVVLN
jgi:hypothetical protein